MRTNADVISQVLTTEQVAAFEETGWLRLEGAADFVTCEDSSSRLLDLLKDEVVVAGLGTSGTAEWKSHRRRLKQIKRQVSLHGLLTNSVESAAAQLLQRTAETVTVASPTLLLTPSHNEANPFNWRVPSSAWHTDAPRSASGVPLGIIALFYLSDVAAAGGGTTVIAGSHRLHINRGRLMRSRDFRKSLKRYEYFRQLMSRNGVRGADFLRREEVIDGVRVQCVELTGSAGDVVLLDARILHAIAENHRPNPRLMARAFYSTNQAMNEWLDDIRARHRKKQASTTAGTRSLTG